MQNNIFILFIVYQQCKNLCGLGCTVAWVAVQTRLVYGLGWQREGERQARDFPVVQEWECTLEKGAWGRCWASSLFLISLVPGHFCFWESFPAETAVCWEWWLWGYRRRSWGHAAVWFKCPQQGLSLAKCIRVFVWELKCSQGWLDQCKANFKSQICCQSCSA